MCIMCYAVDLDQAVFKYLVQDFLYTFLDSVLIK